MNSELDTLYQDIILDHNRSPRNFRILPDADHVVEAYNPLCGDHYTIYLKMDGDLIRDIGFQGSGCAISKASASVMSSMVKGMKREEAEGWFEKFHLLVTEGLKQGDDPDAFGKLAAFAGVSEFPARVKCAILAWHTLKSALHSNVTTVSTE